MANDFQNAPQPIQNHFVPEFYLRHWTGDDGKLWAYRVAGGDPFPVPPEKIAKQRNLYLHPDANARDPFWFEKEMARIESRFAPRWPEIFQSARNKTTRTDIASFIGILAVRHPRDEEQVRNFNIKLNSLASQLPPDETVQLPGVECGNVCTAADIVNLTREDDITTRLAFLSVMPEAAKRFGESLLQRRWHLLKSDYPVFLTCDRPVVCSKGTAQDDLFWISTPGTEMFFPISPTQMLVVADDTSSDFVVGQVTQPQTFNELIVKGADRFVFSKSKNDELPKMIQDWRR